MLGITPMEQLGWIQLHRKFMDWEWYTDTNTKVLFIHCLLKANHKEAKWRGHIIKRGQFLSSLNHLATDTGFSVRNIRTSLKHLESTGDVTREATHQLTKLTICNYDTYNNLKTSSDTPSDKRPTSDRHTGDNKQECKKENNISLSWLDTAKGEYLDFCEKYFLMLKENGKVKKNTNWKTEAWYKAARLLAEKDGETLEGMYQVLNYVNQNIDGQYFPQVWSVPSLREKWLKIKSHFQRNNKQSYSEGRNNA